MFVYSDMLSRTVGSNTLVGRQGEAYFKSSELNELLGFSAFEGGVFLQNAAASCNVDLFFPISGTLGINGGTLRLKRDVVFKSPFFLGSGVIDADTYAIEFPRNISTIEIPSKYNNQTMYLIDSENALGPINSIDWSYDGQYVAVGIDGSNSTSELKIYYFDGAVLTMTASYDFSNKTINTVAWHPTDYYVAVGKTGADELLILYLNIASGTFNTTSSVDIDTVNAITWHSSGSYLAVGQNRSNSLLVYPVTNGILGSVISTNLGAVSTVSLNALSWNTSGDYLAVGLYKNNSLSNEVLVYAFNGSSLTLNASTAIGQNVYAVAWRPNNNQLAVGATSTTENVRLYSHNTGAGTLTEMVTARIHDTYTIYDLIWDKSGNHLAVSRINDSNGYEIKILAYDAQDQILHVKTGYDAGQTVTALAWACENQCILSGDKNGILRVFSMRYEPLLFKDAQLYFGSDVVLTTTVRFEGSCTLNMDGNALDIASGMLVIGDDAELKIEHALIKGIYGNNIHCTHDTSVMHLRNVDLVLDADTTFSTGSLLIEDKVSISGECLFAYQTTQTSIINKKSELVLDIGMTFSYDPIDQNRSLIACTSETSVITLNGATIHATLSGLALTKGKMRVIRDSFISSEKAGDINEGITFGNNDALEDIKIDIHSGQTLSLIRGRIRYKNVNQGSLRFGNLNASLYLYPNTSLYAYQDILFDPGFITLGNYATLGKIIGKNIAGSVRPLGTYFNQWISS